jgi:hypothetical protein
LYIGENSDALLVNCTFFANTGVWGPVFISNSSPTILNCTFSENTGGQAGSLYVDTGDPILRNCVLWNAGSATEIEVVSGTPVVSHSLIRGGWPGDGNVDADPRLVCPSAGDLRLQAGSPAIDAGLNAAVPPEVTVDLDGSPRFVDDPTVEPDPGVGTPPVVDMGAFEYHADCNGNGVIDSVDMAEATSEDCNGNGVPDECEPGEIDGVCGVNLDDFATFALCYAGAGATAPPPGCTAEQFCSSDIEGDGDVDLADFATFATVFGTSQ